MTLQHHTHCPPPDTTPRYPALRRAAPALVLTAMLAAFGLSQAWAQASAKPARSNVSGDYIVAVVNSELVTSVEVNQRLERAKAEIERNGAALPDEAVLRKQVLDGLIEERLQITFARDTGIRVDDSDIDRAVATVAAQNQLSVEQLRERLRAEGTEFTRFRNNLRDQLLMERAREREVIGRIRVNDDDIDQLLRERSAQASVEAQINVAQILITVPEGAAPDLVAQREAIVNQALTRLRSGEDFTKVSRELSEDANREAGGEIGLRGADRLPDLFVAAVKDLAVGAYTAKAIRSGAGFHILKLIDRQSVSANKVVQTRARHILLKVPEGGRPEAVIRRVEDLRRQIERGDKVFEAEARSVSEDGSAAAGGELGWAGPGQFVPEFEQAMNQLPIGGLSPPVVSRFGVHLIQVQERREVSIDPNALRDQARSQLRERKFEAAYLDWVKELRLRAYIEMREPPL